jgi:hypothetical protein
LRGADFARLLIRATKPLKVDDLQVWVYFKPRKNGKQDVLTIAISAREDGEGRIEQWGLLDPATGQFLRTGPNHIDLADIHLSMTMSDREGFLWNDRWLKKS